MPTIQEKSSKMRKKPTKQEREAFMEQREMAIQQMKFETDPQNKLVEVSKNFFEALIAHAKEDNTENVEKAFEEIFVLTQKRCNVNNFPDNIMFDYENYFIPTLMLFSKLKTFDHLTAFLSKDFKKGLLKWNQFAYEPVIVESTEDLEVYTPEIAEYFQRIYVTDKQDDTPYFKTVSSKFLEEVDPQEQFLRDVEFRTFIASESIFAPISLALGEKINKIDIAKTSTLTMEEIALEIKNAEEAFNEIANKTVSEIIMPTFYNIKMHVRNVWKEISTLPDLMK